MRLCEMQRSSAAKLCIAAVVAGVGCSHATSIPNPSAKPKSHAASDAGRDAGVNAGIVVDDDRVTLQTPSIALAPGDDRFFCYAIDVPEDVTITGYTSTTPASLQHAMLARALSREPDGLAECNALYRTRWQALFVASHGHSELTLPDGFAHMLGAGSQLVVAFELESSSDRPSSAALTFELTRSHASGLRTLGTYVLGTAALSIPADATSHADVTCKVAVPVELVAILPEMHARGTAIQLEVGATSDALSSAYASDPFALAMQHVDSLDLKLDVGELAQVGCDYDNKSANALAYREGPDGEACFLLGFAADRDGVSNCLTDGAAPSPGTPAALDAGPRCDAPATDAGIGAPCTRLGGQCKGALRCTADFGSQPGVCTRLGCASNDECGAGATCCKLLVGGFSVCLQDECLPATCNTELP